MRSAAFIKRIWSIHGKVGDYFFLATKSKASDKWRDHHFKWPVQARLEDFFEKYPDDEYNLYFCPTPFTHPQRLKKYVRGSKFLWADLDDAQPAKIKPVPQIAWESSPDRYAALWLLVDFYSGDLIEEKNRALTYKSRADRGGWDLTQVLRVPGTKNHKYAGSPRGRLLWFKDNQYSLDDIPDHVDVEHDGKEVLKKWRKKMPLSLFRTLVAKRATQGKRSDVLWKLEVELVDLGLSEDEVYVLIRDSVWNKFSGRRDEERQLRREIEKAVESRPKKVIRRTLQDEADEDEGEGSRIVRMSDVEEENISWVWRPYIARGKVTIVEGDPGLGKSWLTLALASAITNGRKLPTADRALKGRILLMSAEDGLGDTIRARLRMLDANARRVFAYDIEHEDGLVKLDDIGFAEVEEEVEKIRPQLVIVDPLVAYMGAGVDLHKANETREIMTGLARLAKRTNTAVVVVRHLRKGGADKSIYRGLGSIDITAAARSVIIVGYDPDDEEGRILLHIKNNIGELGPPIRYFLHRKSPRPFKWDGPCDVSVEDVLKTDRGAVTGKGDYDLAKDFLENLDADGEPTDKIFRNAEARGISKEMLKRARKELGVRMVAKGQGDEREVWWKPAL